MRAAVIAKGRQRVAERMAMNRRLTLEHEWKEFLASRGIPVPRGIFVPYDHGEPALPEALKTLHPPFVLKALSPSIVHKTDVGAVRLGICGDEALIHAIREMLADLNRKALLPIAGLLVEEMVEPGLELMLGVMDDPQFERLLVFGLGGTRVEALGDVRFFALPLRPFDVETVVRSIPWLESALVRLGQAGLRALRDLIWRFAGPGGVGLNPLIEQVELNPLIVGRAGVVAVDVRGVFA